MDNRNVRENGYSDRSTRTCPGRNRPEPYGTPQRNCGCENNSSERKNQRTCGCAGTGVRSPLMRRLQELDLALIDTGLYLDAYPTCQEALAYFKRLSCERERVLAEYERQYGPMTLYGAGEKDGEWDWILRPWPWENEAMNEGGRC